MQSTTACVCKCIRTSPFSAIQTLLCADVKITCPYKSLPVLNKDWTELALVINSDRIFNMFTTV